MTIIREIKPTNKIPKPIGPYSQGIKVENPGDMIFISGQIPNHPKTGEIKGDIKEQTERAIKNLRSILEEGGATLDDVVRVTIQLADMNDYEPMNKIYETYFSDPKPARTCSPGLDLANEAKIEIDAIAIKWKLTKHNQ